MAKFLVTHKCGHEKEVQIFGKLDSRGYREEKLKESICEDCKESEIENNIKVQQEKAKQLMGNEDFKTLEGTEKQVLWAISIRENILKNIEDTRNIILDEYKEFYDQFIEDYMVSCESKIKENRNKAKFWIEKFKNDKTTLSKEWLKKIGFSFAYEMFKETYISKHGSKEGIKEHANMFEDMYDDCLKR